MESIGEQAFVITLIYGGILCLGALIVTLLLRNKELGMAKYPLALFLLIIMLHLCTYLLFTTGVIRLWPHLLGLSYPFLFLSGACFYFFVLLSMEHERRWKPADLLHLLPFAAIGLLQLPALTSSREEKLQMIGYHYKYVTTEGPDLLPFLWTNGFILLLMGYSLMSLIRLRKEREGGGLRYQTISKFSIGLLIFGVIFLVTQSGLILSGVSLILSELILTALLAGVVLFLGSRVLGGRSRPFADDVPLSNYRDTSLTDEVNQSVAAKLIHAMEQEKVFLRQGLRLDDLAKHIEVPGYQISKVLNTHMKTNFHDLTARYRVKASTEMLLNGSLERLSIQAIGEECGFNSKASFYRAFKKWAGKTPTEFIQSRG